MATRFYITTPIYYINDVPHLGSAYTTIAADVLARYHRTRGHDTYLLTGTDEHGLKVQRVAEERGLPPQAFADELAGKFKETWPRLGCRPDDFIRTSEERHKRAVNELWKKIEANGDIYLGHYEGLYCVGCEAYYTEKDLKQPGNICPMHERPAETVKEESYFFRLSRYEKPLLEHYEKNPGFIRPESRKNEVVSFVQAGLLDLSVSRTTFQWGIPVPSDPRHVMYVWFDALANYYTALFEPVDNTRFWPCSVHLVGKDIVRFHAVYWPAFLMAAGLSEAELPRQVFAHGFLTYNGQKMSKSLRNTVSPVALADAISQAAVEAAAGGAGKGLPAVGIDTLRYGLMRAISFGHDGDFSIPDLLQRYASELGNSLGNLLNRVLPFAETVPEKGPLGPLEDKLIQAHAQGSAAAAKAFDDHNPTRALEAIWSVLAAANDYVDKAAPWAAKKSDPARLGTIIATLVELLSAVSLMIAPVLPGVADAMRDQLGLPPVHGEVGLDQWPFALPKRTQGDALRRGAPLFPRLEKEKEAEIIARFSAPAEAKPAEASPAPAAAEAAPSPPREREAKPTIAYDDFGKLDLRVGIIVSAARVKKKDKLLELRIDTGDAAPRRIVSGIAAAYAPEALVGRRVVVLCNLAPRDFGKGLVSEGMLLTAEDEGGLKLLAVDGEKVAGATVS
jgi:methionyl-tRNA synthetase